MTDLYFKFILTHPPIPQKENHKQTYEQKVIKKHSLASVNKAGGLQITQ